MVEVRIEVEDLFEVFLHLRHQRERPQEARPRQLPEVHGQIVAGGRQSGVLAQHSARGGDSLPGDVGALGVVGGELGPIVAGAGEVPGGGGIGGLSIVTFARDAVETPGPRTERRGVDRVCSGRDAGERSSQGESGQPLDGSAHREGR